MPRIAYAITLLACLFIPLVYASSAWADPPVRTYGTADATTALIESDDDIQGIDVSPMSFGEAMMTRLSQAKSIQPLDSNAFGEVIDPASGSLAFFQTDIALPGIGPEIAIQRSFSVNRNRMPWFQNDLPFLDWDLELPRLSTTGPSTPEALWLVDHPVDYHARCSHFGRPPPITGGNNLVLPSADWWQGIQLKLPGQGSQELLKRTTENTLSPTMNIPGTTGTFNIVTANHWQFTCLPTTKNGEPGEAFLAVSPDGTKYWFDWMNHRWSDWFRIPRPNGGTQPILSRVEIELVVTRIEDRHGNFVTFDWQDKRLLGINGSDGRKISLAWNVHEGKNHITSVTVQPGTGSQRTWSYQYHLVNGNHHWRDSYLKKTTLPDSSAWEFDIKDLGHTCKVFMAYPLAPCPMAIEMDPQPDPYDDLNWLKMYSGTIKAPTGLTGTFTVRNLDSLRYPYVPYAFPNEPEYDTYQTQFWYDPSMHTLPRITEKKYTGPGVNDTWRYSFGPGTCCDTDIFKNGEISRKGGGGYEMASLVTKHPDGHLSVILVDNQWRGPLEGQIVGTRNYHVNGDTLTALSIHTQTYAAPNTGPFPARIGETLQVHLGIDRLERLHPLKTRTIDQDGATFTRTVETFDPYGRPARVKRYSSLGDNSTQTTAYHNHLPTWTIGRVDSVIEHAGNHVVVQNSYDPITGHHVAQSRFGQPQWYANHHSHGLPRQVTDNANRTTTFDHYKRGIPQTIVYANGENESAVVDDLGQVRSVTDETGATTAYDYDIAGRLSKITYPLNDTVAWLPTTRTFEPVNLVEYGLPAGHWRLTESTGNARAITYFDARWRPVLSRSFDAADESNTRRMVQRRFDHDNRETFASYPLRSIVAYNSNVSGTSTQYDPLGRVKGTTSASELGPLTTTVQWQPGFKQRVTDARGYATTTSFQTFDEPATDVPVLIQAPESVTTTFNRDVFGKATAITRSGTYQGQNVSATRRYVYDPQQRLCKTIDPETAATVFDYTAAGQLLWRAAGLNLPSNTDCQRGSVPASEKRTHTYDPRHRLTGISQPGSATLGYAYFPDGALKTATSDGGTWTYGYNKRRLPETEALALDGQSFLVKHAYDPLGHRSQLTYPGNAIVAFAPNALGEPTRAGNYATTVKRHPNGLPESFAYGNGLAFVQELNTRQLPRLRRELDGGSALADFLYDYDENANLTLIGDDSLAAAPPELAGLASVEDRTLAYDGLNRLIQAHAPAIFGNETFAYDPLDNLRKVTLGSGPNALSLTYAYQGNRLSQITHAQGGQQLVRAYAHDARGHLIQRGDQAHAFDTAGRMIAAIGRESYRYDGHGRRTVRQGPAGERAVTLYGRDGQLLYETRTPGQANCAPADDRIFCHGFQNPSGSTTATRYAHLDGRLVAQQSGNAVTYLHTDHLGSVTMRSDAQGEVLGRTLYEPFGSLASGTVVQGPGFTGHVADAATQLTYMQQRYQDGTAMRFLSPDPVPVDTVTAGNFNRYAYANNNPYKYVDPDGREAGAAYRTMWRVDQGDYSRSDGIGLGETLEFVDRNLLTPLGPAGMGGKMVIFPFVKLLKPAAQVAQAATIATRAAGPSSRLLGQALEGAGHVRLPGMAAHHIVAGSARKAGPARAVLEKFGININDPNNGIFLPASTHARLHTNAYYDIVNDSLQTARTREDAVIALDMIRQNLMRGGL